MKTKQERLSIFLSLVLRHKPEAAFIQLDEHGWADVDALLQGIQQTGRAIDRESLEQIVATDAKGRYSFSEDHTLIRANQGHSVPVDVELTPTEPPTLLYHGTATRFLPSIRAQGLTRQSRLYVHLSSDVETARKVGARHGKSVVLTIPAKQMYDQGYPFFLSVNQVWLCHAVPATFLQWDTELPDSK